MYGNTTASTPYKNRIIRSCCMTIVSIFIIFGNSVCLFIIRRTRNIGMKDTTKVFMISMTFADLAQGIIGAVPATISAGLGYFPGGSTSLLCLYHSTILYSLALNSCCSLLAVTVERYIAIVYPLRHPVLVTVRRSKLVVVSIWFMFQGLLVVLLVAVLHPLIRHNVSSFDPDFLTCFNPSSEDTDSGLFYVTAIFVLVPVLTIICMYIRMVKISQMRRNSSGIRNTSSTTVNTVVASAANKRKGNKAVVTFLIITTASIFAWLPFTLVIFQENILNHRVQSHWKFLSVIFLFSGSWFNVAIYYIMNDKFRATAKRICSSIL